MVVVDRQEHLSVDIEGHAALGATFAHRGKRPRQRAGE
jgi:hypothetical protein